MIKVKRNFKKLEIKVPSSKRFWQAVGIETVSDIRDTTEKGLDADGRSFKPYKGKYRERKVKSGRNATVNLTWTGNMLASMGRGIRATTHGVKVIVSGTEGGKIWANEKMGREFFAISKKSAAQTLKKIKQWVKRNN